MMPNPPPRWMNPSGYSNGRGCYEVEREYNQLLSEPGIWAMVRRWWMRFVYFQIDEWTPEERREIEAHEQRGR